MSGNEDLSSVSLRKAFICIPSLFLVGVAEVGAGVQDVFFIAPLQPQPHFRSDLARCPAGGRRSR